MIVIDLVKEFQPSFNTEVYLSLVKSKVKSYTDLIKD